MKQLTDIFIETAFAIGAQLCREGIWDGKHCNWLGDNKEAVAGRWTVVHRAFGPDLYSGTAGIALFLAYLGRLSDDRLVKETAEGAVEHSLSHMESVARAGRFGFFTGVTGIAAAVAECGSALERPDWIDRGRGLFGKLCEEPVEKEGLDVLGGIAGAICGLLRGRNFFEGDEWLEGAARFGDLLIASGHRGEHGLSWTTLPREMADKDLTGMAHGAAGIGYALMELYRVSHLTRFRTAAEDAFRYEASCFKTGVNNWIDFRKGVSPESSPSPCSLMWCHGAPGIGLTRLSAYEISGDSVYLREMEAAIQTTLQGMRLPSSFCLCHGLGGNAELFLAADASLRRPSWRAIAHELGCLGIANYQEQGRSWPCGVPDGEECPGLMLGLAGIGYFYLRLSRPADVPSILLPAACLDETPADETPGDEGEWGLF